MDIVDILHKEAPLHPNPLLEASVFWFSGTSRNCQQGARDLLVDDAGALGTEQDLHFIKDCRFGPLSL